MLLGLSILIASVSFICYRHPPTSWSFLLWLQRPSHPDALKPQKNAPEAMVEDSKEGGSADAAISVVGDYLKELGMMGDDGSDEDEEEEEPPAKALQMKPLKADLDRKAMPPPPFLKKSSKPRSPPTPTVNLESPSSPQQNIPSFPAANSAQRASGGRGPPSLNPIPATQPPLRSVDASSLISPPTRSPLPNRSPGLAPPPTHTAAPTKPSKKVLLTPGHSPLDWARLTSSPNANLRGLPSSTPYLRVPPSLLKQMTGRKGKDAWTVLGGKVYNISPYLPYHPGGEPELMKCAGRDGTKLFGEVHPWVNWEGMLEGCLVGIAVGESEVAGAPGGLEDMD